MWLWIALGVCTESPDLMETFTIPFVQKTMIVSYAYQGWQNITNVVIAENYEVIGLYSFANSGVETVTFPSTLKEICEGAFQRTKLSSVVLPNGTEILGMYCFQHCTNLVSVELPETVRSIALGSFSCGNTSLEIDVHPNNRVYEFKHDQSMLVERKSNGRKMVNFVVDRFVSITMPPDVIEIGGHGAGWMYKLETANCESCDSLLLYAFRFDYALKNVTVGSKFIKADTFTFENCKVMENFFMVEESSVFKSIDGILYQKLDGGEIKLYYLPPGKAITTYTIPTNMMSFENSAFADSYVNKFALETGHTGLKVHTDCVYSTDYKTLIAVPLRISPDVFEFHPNCIYIENKAFYNQMSLTTVDIPNRVKTIGEYVWSRGHGVLTLTLPNSLEKIGPASFHEARVTNMVIPPLVTKLDTLLFSYAHITNLTLPENVVSIGDRCFNHCTRLTKINFPEKLERIEVQGFYYCTVLPISQFNLPIGLKYIGVSAFEHCRGMAGNITVPKNVAVIDKQAFYMCTGIDVATVVNCNTDIRHKAFYGENHLIRVTCIMTRYFTPYVGTPDSEADVTVKLFMAIVGVTECLF